MRTDNTATALIFLLVLTIAIFTLSSLAQVEPESPDTWPVYSGATFTPPMLASAEVPSWYPTPMPANTNWLTTTPPLYVQPMTPTIRPVIIPRWP